MTRHVIETILRIHLYTPIRAHREDDLVQKLVSVAGRDGHASPVVYRVFVLSPELDQRLCQPLLVLRCRSVILGLSRPAVVDEPGPAEWVMGEAPTSSHFVGNHNTRRPTVKCLHNIFRTNFPLSSRMSFRAGILTVSDKGAAGEREDTSGAAIRELLSGIDATIDRYEIIADVRDLIAERLTAWADAIRLDLIVTTGGTGLGRRDVTPEATLDVIDYEVRGLAEAMRAEGLRHTPMSMLSRAVAGVRGRTLIVNLPGSPRGVRENLSVILPVLPHARELLRGESSEHRPQP